MQQMDHNAGQICRKSEDNKSDVKTDKILTPCHSKAGRKIEKLFIRWGREILYVAHRDKLKSPKKVSI